MTRKNRKNKKKGQRLRANWRADSTSAAAEGSRTLENPASAGAKSGSEKTTSPTKFMALFFGIPVAILIAAVVFRALSN